MSTWGALYFCGCVFFFSGALNAADALKYRHQAGKRMPHWIIDLSVALSILLWPVTLAIGIYVCCRGKR